MGATNTQRDASRLSAGRKFGRYEILARLAAGGMAEVYVARAQGVAGFERLVALKVLHQNLAHEEEFISMFLDEARLAARIRHPNVVPTLDISDTIDAGYYLVMDYIEGDHLGALLASAFKHNDPLPPRVVMRIVSDALGGLGAAHQLKDESGKPLNLVHRDVSPHNIMVGADGVARLTDFGVAKAEDRLTHTREGQVKGKLAYMAPEQASQGIADPRSDLFSMAIILWESFTGQRLFRGETTAATLHKLLTGEIPAPSTIRPDLQPFDQLLKKGLSRDMAARYQTADEFIEAIEDVAALVGGLASLRKVSQAVQFHAADKLSRDRHMITEAVRALGLNDKESHPSLAPYMDVPEPSSPSTASFRSNTGSSASSLSPISGSRHTGKTSPSRVTSRAVPPPPPPRPASPPRGEITQSEVMQNEVGQGEFAPVPAPGRTRIVAVAAGVIALVAASTWAWVSARQETVRVTTMDSTEVDAVTAPPTVTTAAAPTPTAPAAPNAAVTATAEPLAPPPVTAPHAPEPDKLRPSTASEDVARTAPTATGPAAGKRPSRTTERPTVATGTPTVEATPAPPTKAEPPPVTKVAPPPPAPPSPGDFPELNPYH